MRLIFASIVAAATLATLSSPALADNDRGRDHREDHRTERHGDRHENRNWDRDHRGRWNNEHSRRDNRHDNIYRQHSRQERRQHRYYSHNGRQYWGPSARQWTRWNNSWGDPNRYASQWGFDRYDQNRGWQRGNTWYASPSSWADWGGWNWSVSINSGGVNNGYNQYSNNQCNTYRTQDWVNGRRATITYYGCPDRFGQINEQPGSRRVVAWGW